MGTLKKLWKYFLIFIAVFVIVGFLTNMAMKEHYEDMSNYEIKCESPNITVSESKSASTNGYINGTVTNNTGEYLPLKYLKVDFYDKDNIYLGTEYKELKYFNVNETIKFEFNYIYNNVGKIELNITDEMSKKENVDILGNVEDEQVKIALPIAGILVLFTVLP